MRVIGATLVTLVDHALHCIRGMVLFLQVGPVISLPAAELVLVAVSTSLLPTYRPELWHERSLETLTSLLVSYRPDLFHDQSVRQVQPR